MVDLEILNLLGSNNARLKEVFTAQPVGPREKLKPQEKRAREKLIKIRQKWEERISNRLNEHIEFALENHAIYSAVDLAWNAPPITKQLYPLMLYAQGRINPRKCAEALDGLACKEQFVTKDDDGNESIDLPKFVECHVNLVRSVLNRRKAAQTNKYSNLWPYLKYESRSTSEVGKLRADVFSQITDIMADSYDYRANDEEVVDYMMKYAHCVDFIRSAWEKEEQMVRKGAPPGIDTKASEYQSEIVKEGLSWTHPHPTRVFCDNAYPLKSLNSDTGIKYIGFWDVIRAGDVLDDPQWWNRKNLGFTNTQVTMFATYANYFSQYYCTINAPSMGQDLTSDNERLNKIGLYSGDLADTSMVISNYFEKVVPKDEGFGDYPYPVWVRFINAGWNTVIHAQFLPSTPGAVASFNEDSGKQVNVSLAHELLSYQDQMSNLLSYLLLCIRSDNHKVMVLDIDVLNKEQIQQFRAQAKGNSFYNEVAVLEVSRSKLRDLGLDVDEVIKLVETKPSSAIDIIFRAMVQLLTLMERMLAMSPQEQGQPAPREISATETNLLSGTTESVYNHISDSIDSFRAAKKRIIYESYMNFGRKDFRVPVINRYSPSVIKAAGLELWDEDRMTSNAPSGAAKSFTVTGTKERLMHDYIFTSRDGAERSSNLQAAQYLSEVLKSVLPIQSVQQALKKGKFFEMINEIFRMTGAFDLKLEAEPGEEDQPLVAQTDVDVLQQIAQIVDKNTQDIAAIGGNLQQLIAQLRGQPAQNGNGEPSMLPARR